MTILDRKLTGAGPPYEWRLDTANVLNPAGWGGAIDADGVTCDLTAHLDQIARAERRPRRAQP